MKRKIISVLLCVFLLLPFLPAAVFAEEDAALDIAGHQYVESALNSDLTGTGWSWNASENLLTLDGYDDGPIVICSTRCKNQTLRIKISGTNAIHDRDTYTDLFSLDKSGTYEIFGTGTLNIDCQTGIRAFSATFSTICYIRDNVTIQISAKNYSYTRYGINSYASLILQDNARVFVENVSDYGYGINCYNNLTLEGNSSLTVNAPAKFIQMGINMNNYLLTLRDAATLSVISGGPCGINWNRDSLTGSMRLDGTGTVTISGAETALYNYQLKKTPVVEGDNYSQYRVTGSPSGESVKYVIPCTITGAHFEADGIRKINTENYEPEITSILDVWEGGREPSYVSGSTGMLCSDAACQKALKTEPAAGTSCYVKETLKVTNAPCNLAELNSYTATLNIPGYTAMFQKTETNIVGADTIIYIYFKLTKVISTVALTGYKTPKVGETVSQNLSEFKASFSNVYDIRDLYWVGPGGRRFAPNEKFAAGEKYYLVGTIEHLDGYTFATNCEGTINGSSALMDRMATGILGSGASAYFYFETESTSAESATLWGDATGDDKVDSKDLALLRKYMAAYDYTSGTSTVGVEAGADANGDGKIDSKDLSLLRKYMAAYDYTTGTSTVVLGPTK